MVQYRTSSCRRRAAAILAAACGLALAAPAAAQLTEPFPPLFEIESLLPAGGGDGSLGFFVPSDACHSVSHAGDVNADGIDDIIVAGTATAVIFGRPSGFPAVVDPATLTGTDGFRITPRGISVSTVGDVNGDGVDDIIVSPFGADPGVVFGRAGGGFPAEIDLATLDGTNGVRLTKAPNQTTGGADVNGDGISDMLLGNVVVFGHRGPFPASFDVSTVDGSTGFRITDAGIAAVDSAGDINGDGIDDLIVGAPGQYTGYYGSCYCADPGSAYVIFGRASFPRTIFASRLDGSDGFRLAGWGESMTGTSVSGAGDVNADGIDDLLVGSPGAFGETSEAFLLFGRDTAAGPGFPAILSLASFSAEHGVRLKGAEFNGAGASVAGSGDVNGDGIDDVVIGAPYCMYRGGILDCDMSYVVFGTAAPPAAIELEGLDGAAGFRLNGGGGGWVLFDNGEGVSAAGDVNADGAGDFIVSTPEEWPPEARGVYIIFGRMPDAPCYADCDGSGSLDFFDFLCFQNLFAAGDPRADCDDSGDLDFFDFLCFQNAFAAGCP